MPNRIAQRFIKRLETTFSSGGQKYRGISSDLSESGLFIRTQNGFVPGTILDIEIFLPGGSVSKLRGTVRRTVKTAMSTVKNGMGIQLIDKDSNYGEFLKSAGITATSDAENDRKSPVTGQDRKENAETRKAPESMILACPSCNVKNRVSTEKLSLRPRCGKCGTELKTSDTD